jgi:hypothetical protein
MTFAQSRLHEIERQIVCLPTEMVVIFSQLGSEYWIPGDERSVFVPPHYHRHMYRGTLLHNHPIDVTFSVADIVFSCLHQVSRLMVVTPTRRISLHPAQRSTLPFLNEAEQRWLYGWRELLTTDEHQRQMVRVFASNHDLIYTEEDVEWDLTLEPSYEISSVLAGASSGASATSLPDSMVATAP